jgi:hypothetical protein
MGKQRMRTVIAFWLVRLAITGLVLMSLAPAHASPPEWLACPDASSFDPRTDIQPRTLRLRALAPSAGAVTSADLAAQARLAALAYDMYRAYQQGEDPATALPQDLRMVGLVFGDPGLGRRWLHRARETRTLFGVVADDVTARRRFIILRGTLEPVEWLRNTQARMRPYPAGASQPQTRAHVHRGFYDIFESLEIVSGDSRGLLSQALPGLITSRKVTFIGHSLGGALATLAGVEAARQAPDEAGNMRIVTFASPRVGDPGFAALAQAVGRIDRVCNIVDVVTAIPPSTPGAPYTHVGEVFRVSPFDWPDFDNKIIRPARQIACWHSIDAYGYMAEPAKAVAGLKTCAR